MCSSVCVCCVCKWILWLAPFDSVDCYGCVQFPDDLSVAACVCMRWYGTQTNASRLNRIMVWWICIQKREKECVHTHGCLREWKRRAIIVWMATNHAILTRLLNEFLVDVYVRRFLVAWCWSCWWNFVQPSAMEGLKMISNFENETWLECPVVSVKIL